MPAGGPRTRAGRVPRALNRGQPGQVAACSAVIRLRRGPGSFVATFASHRRRPARRRTQAQSGRSALRRGTALIIVVTRDRGRGSRVVRPRLAVGFGEAAGTQAGLRRACRVPVSSGGDRSVGAPTVGPAPTAQAEPAGAPAGRRSGVLAAPVDVAAATGSGNYHWEWYGVRAPARPGPPARGGARGGSVMLRRLSVRLRTRRDAAERAPGRPFRGERSRCRPDLHSAWAGEPPASSAALRRPSRRSAGLGCPRMTAERRLWAPARRASTAGGCAGPARTFRAAS